jgi:hypothetical protein
MRLAANAMRQLQGAKMRRGGLQQKTEILATGLGLIP